jgi:hypothetical protein
MLKRTQLRELAIMRGNYRSDKDFAYGSDTHEDHHQDHHQDHHLDYHHRVPFPAEVQCAYPPPPPMSYDAHFAHSHAMAMSRQPIRMQMQELRMGGHGSFIMITIHRHEGRHEGDMDGFSFKCV